MRANPMKKIEGKWVYLGALTLAMGLAPLAPAYGARKNTQNASSNRQSTKVQQKKVKYYVGKIEMTKSGKYALIISAHGNKGWYLNDQSVVKKYVGQRVRVRGILHRKRDMIQVLAIQPTKK